MKNNKKNSVVTKKQCFGPHKFFNEPQKNNLRGPKNNETVPKNEFCWSQKNLFIFAFR